MSVDPNPYLYQAPTAFQPAAPAAKAPAAKPPATSEGPTTGSGFAVTDKYLVTNAHVVNGCKSINVDDRGVAKVRAIDKTNDLALLETVSQPGVARLRDGRLRQGEPVTVLGFPFAGILGDGPQVTAGNVTALSGMGSDTRFIQISAAVQPGNSGGPVLDQSGNVIGVVVSKLGLKFAAVTGDLPQNLNFAISLDALRGFLNANGVKYGSAPMGRALSTADVADVAKPFTNLVRCSN
ncbi:serine protease [Variovorax sp. J22P168]|uniref:S1C family serine protease n=1 Tax=Variovorax jilinensis TaxID=3053513 RepID=UPI00257800D5|nr:serine protease [Variovorax sp. J22P168]MDM0015771.1 serine protease [Variovorax sp. J22P168]